MNRRLFELSTADGCSISPYVWRSKFVLARKGLAYRSELVGFTDIRSIGTGGFATLPVLYDSGEWVGDSWAIADYLDRAYPERPLFETVAERAGVRFFDRWMASEITSPLFQICALDILNRMHHGDRAYFRSSRERRLGQSLEATHEQRDAYLPILRQRLQPLRLALRGQSFVGGAEPGYADYIAAGVLIWAGSVATIPLLTEEDALLPWLRRCLDLYGAVGADLALPAFPGLAPMKDAP